MEEPKPAQTPAQTQIPDSKPDPDSNIPQNQTLPQSQPPMPAPPSTLPPQSKKRPLNQNIQDSPYYKMRLIVKDLRPHFIEVLKTSDFQKCDAARKIQEQMKILMGFYKEMIAEPAVSSSLENSNNGRPVKDTPNGQDIQPDRKFVKPSKDRAVPTGNTNERQLSSEDGKNNVGFFVGGSAFGWNFTSSFGNSEPVYYGRTKEAYRAAKVIVDDKAAPPSSSS
ncbi:uncharacterized protein LOC124922812 [Impatiens glandulifera]|uniref:uncharacterized protein LOC124922812 n=1 Tax=Impatiens glandulifera TaxID=253017 RepID=UPI001FB0A05F|nr:uncharacterized protein LOC124922812 [Impatiens glandulifera]